MSWIVIEMWPDPESAAIVTTADGKNEVFDDIREAQEVADDCQNGKIVEV